MTLTIDPEEITTFVIPGEQFGIALGSRDMSWTTRASLSDLPWTSARMVCCYAGTDHRARRRDAGVIEIAPHGQTLRVDKRHGERLLYVELRQAA